MSSSSIAQSSEHAPDGTEFSLATLDRDLIDAHEFWTHFVKQLRLVLGADQGLLLERRGATPWQVILASNSEGVDSGSNPQHVIAMADAAVSDGICHREIVEDIHWLAFPLALGPRGELPNQSVIVLNSSAAEFEWKIAIELWLSMVAEIPRHHVLQAQWIGMGGQYRDSQELYDVVRSSLRVGEQERFMGAAFELCNELVARYRATHVMLGWIKRGMVELCAISQVEKFDVKSSASRSIVEAMEEVVDQKVPIAYPEQNDMRTVNRAHEQCAKVQGAGSLTSIPIQWQDKVVGVLTVESANGTLDDTVLWELELVAQLCVQHLVRSERRDRWLGRRLLDWLGERATYWFEPKHLGFKLAVMGLLVAFLVSMVLPWPYRVEAQASLHSKDLLFIPAPFDGYLSEVYVDIGDVVAPGDLMVALDIRDLEQEKRMAAADVTRYQKEAEKAQAQKDFAEMQILRSREQQAQAKLALVQKQLDAARVVAPMSGTVVEGELRKNLGSPVRRGDLLLKLAQNRNLYLEVAVDQSDVQEVFVGMTGEVAFVGRPEDRFAFTVTSIEPAAVSRDGGNFFLTKAKIDVQPGWYPGLGGTAKLDAGEHSLLWVLTRRSVRYLRGLLWI